MNRAILVVICDFVVLSMMSMSDFSKTADPAAFVGQGSGGNHAVLDAALSEKIIMELEQRNIRLEAAYAEAAAAALEGAEADRLRMESLAAELAAARVQLEYLTTRLALTPEEIGELSAEALQQLWENEARSRELAEVRYEAVSGEVTYLREEARASQQELLEVSGALAAEIARNQSATELIDELFELRDRQAEDIAERDAALAERDAALAEKDAALAEKDAAIAAGNASLAAKDSAIQERDTALAAERSRNEYLAAELGVAEHDAELVSAQLAETTEVLAGERQRLAESSAQLEYARGQLESIISENEANRILLAEVRSQLEAERRRAREAEEAALMREAELRRNLAVIERDYTQTVSELSRMRSERDSAQQQRDDYKDAMDSAVSAVRETESRNQELTEQIREAEARNINVVQPRYRETVRMIGFSLREKRLLIDYVENRQFFWPEIVLDGRNFVIGDIRALTGYDNNRYGESITGLSVTGSGADGKPLSVLGLMTPAADRRVALIEVAPSGAVPLRPITREELQERGLNDLYVFKAGSNGESFLLGDRGVLDIDSVSSMLRVRNRRRGREAAALAVEPGDFILSKEGYFVGVAVGLTPKNSAGDDEALIFVFPSGNALDGAMNIPLQASGGMYSAFVAAMSAMQNNWKVFDSGVDQ